MQEDTLEAFYQISEAIEKEDLEKLKEGFSKRQKVEVLKEDYYERLNTVFVENGYDSILSE